MDSASSITPKTTPMSSKSAKQNEILSIQVIMLIITNYANYANCPTYASQHPAVSKCWGPILRISNIKLWGTQHFQVHIAGKQFTVIDLANAFFSIPVHRDSQYWFAFSFHGKNWTFTRLCPGFATVQEFLMQR